MCVCFFIRFSAWPHPPWSVQTRTPAVGSSPSRSVVARFGAPKTGTVMPGRGGASRPSNADGYEHMIVSERLKTSYDRMYVWARSADTGRATGPPRRLVAPEESVNMALNSVQSGPTGSREPVSACDACGLIGTALRELDRKTPIFFRESGPDKSKRMVAWRPPTSAGRRRARRRAGRARALTFAEGDTVSKRPSPLNVPKDAYDHSCY